MPFPSLDVLTKPWCQIKAKKMPPPVALAPSAHGGVDRDRRAIQYTRGK